MTPSPLLSVFIIFPSTPPLLLTSYLDLPPPSYQRWWQQNRESSLSWKTIMRRKAVLLFSLACCHTCLQFTYLNSKLFTPKQPHLEVPEHSGGGSRYDVRLSFYPPPSSSDSVSFLATPSPPLRTDVICTWPLTRFFSKQH